MFLKSLGALFGPLGVLFGPLRVDCRRREMVSGVPCTRITARARPRLCGSEVSRVVLRPRPVAAFGCPQVPRMHSGPRAPPGCTPSVFRHSRNFWLCRMVPCKRPVSHGCDLPLTYTCSCVHAFLCAFASFSPLFIPHLPYHPILFVLAARGLFLSTPQRAWWSLKPSTTRFGP